MPTQIRRAAVLHMSNFNLYEQITNTIIKRMEAGIIPWHKPWETGVSAPSNISGHFYRGINFWNLLLYDYPSPFWLTFNQISQLGGKVKKGEKGTMVVFWKLLSAEQDEQVKRIPLLKYYYVFNVSQAEGLTDIKLPAHPEPFNNDFTPLEKAENIINSWPDAPLLTHGGDRAFYSPGLDTVTMPLAKHFRSSEEYYSTLFHEFTHSTGHRSRLNRHESIKDHKFGSKDYSHEELVAEMGAAFLCGVTGIENKTIDNSTAYIQSWIRTFKNDPKVLVIAASQAQKACDYILQAEPVMAE